MSKSASLHPLTVVDHVLTALVITPLVLTFWWSSWSIFDIYVFPDDETATAWTSLGVGASGTLIFYLVQDAHAEATAKLPYLLEAILKRLYIYTFGACTVQHWRGVWYLLDLYTGVTWQSALTTHLMAIVLLGAMRSFNNCKGAPVLLVMDIEPDIYVLSTRMRKQIQHGKLAFAMDCFLTATIIHSLVVFYWRGGWTLIDLYIYPDDPVTSAWMCLVIGYALVALSYTMEGVATIYFPRLTKLPHDAVFRTLLMQIVYLVACASAVFTWRGFWNTYALHVWPQNPNAGVWLMHCGGVTVMLSLQTLASIWAKGCDIEGSHEFGCRFLLFYTRFIHNHMVRSETTTIRTVTVDRSAVNSEDSTARAL